MKKIVMLSIIFFFLPHILLAEEYSLKLRTNYNSGYMRIVLEGPDEIITRAIVNQKGQNITVAFPGSSFRVLEENTSVSYRKTDKYTVIFSPGDFTGLKVFNLKRPSRLVIDVYQDVKQEEHEIDSGVNSAISSLGEGPDSPTAKSKIIVIDPGHGGFENGIIKDDHTEKNTVLDISRKLSILAKEGSFNSILTRAGDLYMPMNERIKYANSKDADIFISLHIGNHKEIVIYIPVITEHHSEVLQPYLYNKGQEEHLKKTVTLLNALKGAATAKFGTEMVKVRPLPYSMLSKIETAALMIELPSFEYANYTDEFKATIANTINNGLFLYEENETEK